MNDKELVWIALLREQLILIVNECIANLQQYQSSYSQETYQILSTQANQLLNFLTKENIAATTSEDLNQIKQTCDLIRKTTSQKSDDAKTEQYMLVIKKIIKNFETLFEANKNLEDASVQNQGQNQDQQNIPNKKNLTWKDINIRDTKDSEACTIIKNFLNYLLENIVIENKTKLSLYESAKELCADHVKRERKNDTAKTIIISLIDIETNCDQKSAAYYDQIRGVLTRKYADIKKKEASQSYTSQFFSITKTCVWGMNRFDKIIQTALAIIDEKSASLNLQFGRN